jgi:hypothetical protein
MADTNLFTADEVWKGGFYELSIQPSVASSEELCSLLKALWTFPSLQGCYLRKDCEPADQRRVQPCEAGVAGHLYGVATLPNGTVIPCGSVASDYPGEEDWAPSYYICFYLTMCALSRAFPVGAYPFGPMDNVSEWKTQVDSFLVEIATWIHRTAPFDLALVGFEVDVSTTPPETIRAKGIPEKRDAGILWSDSVGLKWYPATRP